MAHSPGYAMQVSDLAAGLAFFTDKFGFTLLEEKPAEDIAYLLDIDGDALLLAGPAAQDIPSYLAAPKFIAKPGERAAFGCENIEALQAELTGKGVTDLSVSELRHGDRVLYVKAPDYTFEFVQHADVSFEELLHNYANLPAELDEALAGLSDADMGLALTENSWNIRQITHHLADADILFGEQIKVMLSSPGTQMPYHVPVGNDRISTAAEYRERPVASSVALFRAFHNHILDISVYVPNASENYIEFPGGRKITCNEQIRGLVQHANEHIEEIWAIRRKHGK